MVYNFWYELPVAISVLSSLIYSQLYHLTFSHGDVVIIVRNSSGEEEATGSNEDSTCHKRVR
jgi:hypothetical protein